MALEAVAAQLALEAWVHGDASCAGHHTLRYLVHIWSMGDGHELNSRPVRGWVRLGTSSRRRKIGSSILVTEAIQ